MGKETTKDLIKFLKPFPDSVKETTLKLRDFIWDLYPDSNEIIYDNYNALAIGFSTSDRTGDTLPQPIRKTLTIIQDKCKL